VDTSFWRRHNPRLTRAAGGGEASTPKTIDRYQRPLRRVRRTRGRRHGLICINLCSLPAALIHRGATVTWRGGLSIIHTPIHTPLLPSENAPAHVSLLYERTNSPIDTGPAIRGGKCATSSTASCAWPVRRSYSLCSWALRPISPVQIGFGTSWALLDCSGWSFSSTRSLIVRVRGFDGAAPPLPGAARNYLVAALRRKIYRHVCRDR
jgi:hypothetical protein